MTNKKLSVQSDDIISEVIHLIGRAEQRAEARVRSELINRLTDGRSAVRSEGHTRATPGTSKALIERALRAAGATGLKAAEIKQHAETEEERALANATLYNELSRGRKAHVYKKDSQNRWHLRDEKRA